MESINKLKSNTITSGLLHNINKKSYVNISIMEVCGTHTRAIYKNGLEKLLPENINLISGPGCPVCVTDLNYIDSAIELCKNKSVLNRKNRAMVKLYFLCYSF